MRSLYPDHEEMPDKKFSYRELELPDCSTSGSGIPYVFINMVSSLDGKISVSGRSGAIGSSFDRNMMRQLRSLSDAVMVGSGTVRSERVSLTTEGKSSPEPLALIVSSSLDLPLRENLSGSSRERTFVITTGRSVEVADVHSLSEIEEHATIIKYDSEEGNPGSVDLLEALKLLGREHGVRRLLVEGGPGLNHCLISNGLVDEIFLTLSPKIISGRQEESLNIVFGELLDEAREARLISVQEADSELFLRYSLRA